MIAVVGAGAMGAALAAHWSRQGTDSVLLATDRDDAVLAAWEQGASHPALGIALHHEIPCKPPGEWPEVLAEAEFVVVAVSSAGLVDVVAALADLPRADATWVLATKGWQTTTLQSPSAVVAEAIGDVDRVVSLAGPGLAPEIVAGAPTALLCAGRDRAVTRRVARSLRGPTFAVVTTDDVVGAETGSAYKNVVALAVGMCEGLADRLVERAFLHTFANARAAVFAQGLIDMVRLTEALGGRADTIIGLGGAGDLYVTCLGGRNGRFGRLIGAGQTTEQASRAIGSTVEGIPNAAAALALGAQVSVDLPTARVVEAALARGPVDAAGVEELTRLFTAALSTSPNVLRG